MAEVRGWTWRYGFTVVVGDFGVWVGVPLIYDNVSLSPIGFFSYRGMWRG